jgi:NAD(P)-dependent dehydrogenase (short-subunit alcohol dehydrogenase family)
MPGGVPAEAAGAAVTRRASPLACRESVAAADAEIGHAAADVLAQYRLGQLAARRDRAILFLLSPLASYINGILLTVDGGWTVTQ